MSDDKKKLIIIGASGHGKVILDIALLCGYEVLGFLDDDITLKENAGYPVLGVTAKAPHYVKREKEKMEFILAIGNNTIRQKLDQEYKLSWATLIHPKAVIGRQTSIGEGTVVMAGAVINPSAKIGRHCIINTSSVVEHDNLIGDYVHISPGAVLAGTVTVGKCSHIGAGAVVINNLSLTENTILGAGATAVKDIGQPGTYVGTPARRMKDGKNPDSGQL
ncbi:MAG: acetyltransferase [Lachnospiraceae bacterium]|nr:acetyltransferase [Lachnospiraceae bacterium]